MSAEDFLKCKTWCFYMDTVIFKKLDTDNDGYITMANLERGMHRALEYFQKQKISDPALLEKFKAGFEKQMKGMDESIRKSKDEFLRETAEEAAADLERIKRGEEPVLATTSVVFFDLMDSDGDGVITEEEFYGGYRATGWDNDTHIAAAFQGCHDGTGKVRREKMVSLAHDFWYKYDHESVEKSIEGFMKSKEWRTRLDSAVFSLLDTDGDGYITKADHEYNLKNVVEYFQKQKLSDPTRLDRYKAHLESQLTMLDSSVRTSKEEFIQGVAHVAAADQARIKKGEEPLLVKSSTLFFDLVDSDCDGVVSKEEFCDCYRALGWDDSMIEEGFKGMDDGTGKGQREKAVAQAHDFWYKYN